MSNRTNAEENERIGLMLQSIRESQCVTQQEIADIVGLTRNHISKIERGNSKASISVLLGYCEACQVTPNEILDYQDSGTGILPELKKSIKTLKKHEQRKLNELIRLYKS